MYTTTDVLPEEYVTGLMADPVSGVWVTTEHYLGHFDGTEWFWWDILDISLYHDIRLFPVMVFGGDGALYISGKDHLYRFDGTDTAQLKQGICRALTSDMNGDVWGVIDTDTGANALFKCTQTSAIEISRVDIDGWTGDISVDRTGRIWVSSYGLIYVYEKDSWTQYSTDDGLLFDTEGIAFETDGTPWIYSKTNGVARFDGDSWTSYTDGTLKIPDIRWILHDAQDALWMISYGRAGALKIVSGEPERITVPRGSNVSQACKDRKDRIWLANKYYLTMYCDGELTTIKNEMGINPLSMYFDSQDRLWLGTGEEDTVALYTPDPPLSVSDSDHHTMYDIGNYPNPFNPRTTISYTLLASSEVTLSVYAVTGQRVATLVDEPMPVGTHTAVFDGKGLASGIYFYTVQYGGHTETKKMMLVK